MDFDLSKPQKLLKQSARDLLARQCKPELVRRAIESDDAFDEDLWQAIVDQGWTGLLVPESQGGLGLGVVELAAVAEETGRVCMPGPFLSTTFAAALLTRVGATESLEPEMKATVALDRNFVYDAGVADVIFWVEGDQIIPMKHARVRRTPSMDETRKLYTVEPPDQHNGIPCTRSAVQEAIDIATVALCAEMVGGMQRVLEMSVEYAKTRQQFGRAIGSFQAVQHQCADMLLWTESARSATYYAAWALTPLAVSMAKAYCSDAYRETANRAVQVHGGIGFTWEHDLHLYYKRSKASETLFGDATVHRERIASLVIDEVPAARDAPILAMSGAGS